jgi:hypothetical protein
VKISEIISVSEVISGLEVISVLNRNNLQTTSGTGVFRFYFFSSFTKFLVLAE